MAGVLHGIAGKVCQVIGADSMPVKKAACFSRVTGVSAGKSQAKVPLRELLFVVLCDWGVWGMPEKTWVKAAAALRRELVSLSVWLITSKALIMMITP